VTGSAVEGDRLLGHRFGLTKYGSRVGAKAWGADLCPQPRDQNLAAGMERAGRFSRLSPRYHSERA
jgi:hypothetical protein